MVSEEKKKIKTNMRTDIFANRHIPNAADDFPQVHYMRGKW